MKTDFSRYASSSFDSRLMAEIAEEYKGLSPSDLSAKYLQRRSEFLENLSKEQKNNNSRKLSALISGITSNCTDKWKTSYAINEIQSANFFASCNPNCDTSTLNKVSGLNGQLETLNQKLAEFQNNQQTNPYIVQKDLKLDKPA